MDLKIKDVSELLNVSETTIRRWLVDGKIPAYRINYQYRFNRLEIEDWVMGQKIGSNNPGPFMDSSKNCVEENIVHPYTSGGNKQFSLFRAIYKGGVLRNVPGSTKDEVIRNAMKLVAADLSLDAEVISDLLLDREALQSTALNNGIAIPHTRDFLLDAHLDMVSVVFPEKPIPYDAMDGKPVNTLFFLFASDDKRHLHLLAKIAHLSSQKETLALLSKKPTKEVLLEYIKEWEGNMPHKL
ncbi:MAG: PTS sugar transporter subunit IIA [Parachlamydiaceae bacterium]|nr:PTS sugar transporter subunit IIA [Parachlamydiaceae bacterium]